MALLCNYQKFGTTFNSAYVRIERLQYVAKPKKITSKSGAYRGEDGNMVFPEDYSEVVRTAKKCNIIVAIYHSEASRTAADAPIEIKHEYVFDVTDGSTLDLFDQGYAYLKTLPEFTGAVDA